MTGPHADMNSNKKILLRREPCDREAVAGSYNCRRQRILHLVIKCILNDSNCMYVLLFSSCDKMFLVFAIFLAEIILLTRI